MEEDLQCKLKYRPITDKRQYTTYLASFPNGRISSLNSDKVKFTGYKRSPTALSGVDVKKDKKILVASTEKLDYVGNNFSETILSKKEDLFKYHVGVFNKRTKRMKVYDTELFYCKPLIKSTIESVNTELTERDELTYREKCDDLTSTFGTKLKQRSIKSKTQYFVKDSTMTNSITTAVDEAVISLNDGNNTSNTLEIVDDSIIPAQNQNAKSEGEVYNLHDIISEAEYTQIEHMALEIQNISVEDIDALKTNAKYSNYVLYYLQNNLPGISLNKCKILAYYNYLKEFFQLKYKDLQKKNPIPHFPDTLRASFLTKYLITSCNANGRETKSFPQRMKDKLLVHSLILALIIEDFEVNMMILQADFKLSFPKLSKIAHAIGCHVVTRKSKGTEVKYSVLTLPLYRPMLKSFKNRKMKF